MTATDFQASNQGSNQMNETESTVIKTAEDVEDQQPSMANRIAEDEKLSTRNSLLATQEMNQDESPSFGEKEDIDSVQSSPLNELYVFLFSLESTVCK